MIPPNLGRVSVELRGTSASLEKLTSCMCWCENALVVKPFVSLLCWSAWATRLAIVKVRGFPARGILSLRALDWGSGAEIGLFRVRLLAISVHLGDFGSRTVIFKC